MRVVSPLLPARDPFRPDRHFFPINKLSYTVFTMPRPESVIGCMSSCAGVGARHGISLQPEPPKRRSLACSMRGCRCRQPGLVPSAVQDTSPIELANAFCRYLEMAKTV
jgi:hypothetical protein